jgi:putative ABC transport system permease protein
VALGASRGQMLRLLAAKGVALALAGAALGVGGGVVAGRLLSSQLSHFDPADAWSFVAGTGVAIVVTLMTSIVPVWRAARLDPAIALRDE